MGKKRNPIPPLDATSSTRALWTGSELLGLVEALRRRGRVVEVGEPSFTSGAVSSVEAALAVDGGKVRVRIGLSYGHSTNSATYSVRQVEGYARRSETNSRAGCVRAIERAAARSRKAAEQRARYQEEEVAREDRIEWVQDAAELPPDSFVEIDEVSGVLERSVRAKGIPDAKVAELARLVDEFLGKPAPVEGGAQ